MRYLFLLIILYLCFNFVTLGQETGIFHFEKKPYWAENFDKKEVLMISYGDLKKKNREDWYFILVLTRRT